MHLHELTTADDPRLDDYRELKERRLDGKLVAESELVVRKLLESSFEVLSVLVTPPRLESLRPALTGDYPVYVVPQPVMDAVAGFHVHRGCLAVARRPPHHEVPDNARTIVVLEDLVDNDNLGSMVRNAAALGADAVLLSPRCADPWYRKSIRTSTGHCFTLPIVRAAAWPDDLVALKPRYELVAAALGGRPLTSWTPREHVAVVLGTEGAGLSKATVAACDLAVTIPMSPRADSLNVAVAGAIVLYHLASRRL